MEKIDKYISYHDGFASIKIIVIVVLVLMFGLCGFIFYSSSVQTNNLVAKIDSLSQQVVVINSSDGSSFEGTRRALNTEERNLEYQELVEQFLFFMYSFNETNFKYQTSKGADISNEKTWHEIMSVYDAKKMYSTLIDKQMSQSVKDIEVIITGKKNGMIEGTFKSIRMISTPLGKGAYEHDGKFVIRDTDSRTVQNKKACIINDWYVTNTKKIKR